jgi:geranylgeranyl diphosphate synthase type I
MIEGQYMDISFEGRIDITLNQYMSMISRKTGALIRCSLHLGAVMGTENLRTLEIFRRTGTSLGYVFQIRDDILGIWGQEESTGKPVGIDILRKKNSLPIVHAMDKADSKGRERLREIYSLQSLGEPEVLAVLDIMEQAGTRDYAQGLAHQYEEEALKSFSDAMLPDSYKFDFGVLSHFLAVREY